MYNGPKKANQHKVMFREEGSDADPDAEKVDPSDRFYQEVLAHEARAKARVDSVHLEPHHPVYFQPIHVPVPFHDHQAVLAARTRELAEAQDRALAQALVDQERLDAELAASARAVAEAQDRALAQSLEQLEIQEQPQPVLNHYPQALPVEPQQVEPHLPTYEEATGQVLYK